METPYRPRIIDEELSFRLRTFGAVNIVGPKGCGKTRTGEMQSRSLFYFQSLSKEEAKILSEMNPGAILYGERPRLIDEWQDAPAVWDRVRFECDHSGPGQFILTGSTSKKVETGHTGTGRISELRIYTMSLYESGESNGQVSLGSLFEGDPLENGCKSNLTIEDLIFASCRGGWPYAVNLSDKRSQLAVAKEFHRSVFTRDMFSVDDKKRNPKAMEGLLRAYSRNISTLAKKTTLLEDSRQFGIGSENTLDDYISVLEKLYIVDDLRGWAPPLRTSSGVRTGPKRNMVDPSLVVAALGTSPEQLGSDLNTFGFIFECLAIRDLRVYSSALGGELSYYHDRNGLEADAVLHLDDGRYALIEFKLGSSLVEQGRRSLNKLEKKIRRANEEDPRNSIGLPAFKMVVTGTEYGYRCPDGVYVVPIGCLGP